MPATAYKAMRLGDGRQLSFSDTGDADGTPILFCHGNGQCRLGRHPDDEIAGRLGVRLISVDRPGIAHSTYLRGGTLLDWGTDVEALADALGLPTFGVLGWSGGGPYAAACAHRLPDRVLALSLVSGLAPVDQRGAMHGMSLDAVLLLRLAGASPLAMRAPLTFLSGWATHNPEVLMRIVFRDAPACDREILARTDIHRMFVAAYREAAIGGVPGLAHEVSLLARPWGFAPQEIRQPVAIYHGDADRLVPLAMGRKLAAQIPNASLQVFGDEGHQLIWPRWEVVLREIAEATRAGAVDRRAPEHSTAAT